jgi:choice-of-anchor B domain-containing protein
MKQFLILLLFIVSFSSFAQKKYNIDLVFHWSDSTLDSSSAHENTYNEVWGFVQNGKEYGVIGSSIGTHIFDLSNPLDIKEVEFIAGETQGDKLIHRDYHDYKGYLYIVSDENDMVNGDTSKLKIVDLSYLPDSASVVYNEKTFFTRSHNIFIDTLNAKLYTCGGDNNPGVRVFSLNDPENPTEIGSIDQNSHDVFVRNDTAYVNGGTDGMFIYDFADMQNPSLIGELTSYPQQGYNHSGWLSDDSKTYVMADETHNMDVKVLDVSDMNNIIVLDTIDTELDSASTIAHNVMIRGNYAFVAYYFDGLYIFNIEDPANPFISGYYHTSNRIHQMNKYEGNWGVYCLLPSGLTLASDMQTGFYVFDIDHAVGIEKLEPENVTFETYPNPATKSISINNLPAGAYNYSIMSISGKLITSEKLSNNSITIPVTVQNGSYILNVYNNDNSFSKQIVITK